MANRRTPKRPARTAPRPFPLPGGWAAVVLALMVVLFFHEVVVGGKTFVSPDATAPAGFARVGGQSLFEDRVYPLWNPFVFLGMPSFASGTYNPLIYPPDWPLALLQKILPLPDLTWLLIYYFLGGWFLFLLAREWGARPEGALLGAAAFVFAPNLVAVGSHGHGSQLVSSAYTPLLLWLATRWMRGRGLAHLGGLALAGGFQMLRGHVQICFYSWLAVAVYVVVEWLAGLRRPGGRASRTARAAGVALAAALAFGIAAFYNLPLRDYAAHSIRGGGAGGGAGMEYATQWSLAPYELPTLVVPGWAGFGGSTYWGGMPFTDYPNAYVGVVAALLALPAFLRGGPPRVFALLIAVFALLVSFGKHFPLYELLYHHLPLFNKFRVPVMVILLFQVAAAAALAWGWSAILDRGADREGRSRTLDRLMWGAAALLGAALVAGVFLQDVWRDRYVAGAVALRGTPEHPFSPQLAAFAYRGFVSDLTRACVLGLLAVAAAWAAARGRLTATVATIGVLALLAVDLWPVSGRVMQPVIGEPARAAVEYGRDDVVDFLEKAAPPGTFRILPVDEFQSNRFSGFAIASLGGYHAAKTRLFQDFLEANLVDNLGWMRLLNVRYVVTGRRIASPPPYLREVHAGSGFVYENLLAMTRVTLLDRYRVVTPARAILDSVRLGTSESGEVTFLEREPGLELGPVLGATATLVSSGLNEVVVDVETPGPALLRLADEWYPDWRATVDGRPVEILKADYLLRAVPVPAGAHRVEFRFQSPALRSGLILSLASLALALGLIAAGRIPRMGRRPRPPAAPAAAEGG